MFSVRVPWSELASYLETEYKRKIIRVPGDGVCFLKSVKHCLECDLDIEYSIDQISDKIFDEICDNSEIYTQFHMNSKRQLIGDTLKYLNNRMYTIDVVDIVVQACANALKVNIYIYECTGPRTILLPMYSKCHSNRNIFLLYDRQGGSSHWGDHYSAVVEDRGTDRESPKVYDSTDSTNVKNKVPNEQNTNTNNTNQLQLNESESSGKGLGDLRENISDVRGKFGDEFDCEEGGYFDEFGDVIDCDGASGVISDVNMAETSNGNQREEIHLTQDTEQENEGNDLIEIDLTQEIPQTNEADSVTNDHDSIASTNKTKNFDTDVEIVSDPCDIEDGVEIPESYKREKRAKKPKHKKKFINYVKFAQMDSVLVEEIPWDVDRDQKYRIECEEDEFIDKAKDGRWFDMHTSSRKGLIGKRKAGTCQGSLMCENNTCPKLLSEGIPNTNEFTKDSGVDVCKCCGYFVYRQYCGVLKVIEFDREANMMTILYQGEHNCRPKPNRKKKLDEIKNIMKNDTSVHTPAEARRQVIKNLLAKGKVAEAVRVSRKMDDTSLLEKMRYMSKEANTCKGIEDEVEAFKNLRTLRMDANKVDNYLIYKMNCGAINTGDTYIFKTSRYALEVAAKMDVNRKTTRGKPSILCKEKAFFDGMHSRCKGYKTLTLWMHHPGMRKMQRLATMDCKKESTDMIALFFETFNEALAEVVGEKGYKFNPSMICMDEAGANLQGLRKVYGDEFMERVVSCQFHFKQCARRQLKNIDENDQATFMHLVTKICLAQTVAEYKKYADALEHICVKNKCVRWYNWWKVRRYHLVPALRGFGWTGSNWAEIGHSTMKRSHKVWLSVAAFEDIADFIIQENNYRSFIANTGKTVGKGPTQFTKRQRERRAQKKYIESACDAILTTDLRAEVEKHTDPDAGFIPSNASKHRVPKKFSTKNPVQKFKDRNAKKLLPEKVTSEQEQDEDADNECGTSSDSDLDDEYRPAIQIQKDNDEDSTDAPDDRVPPTVEPIIPQRRVLPARKRRGKNRKYHSTTPAETSSEEEMAMGHKGRVLKDVERQKMNTNPPTYVRMKPIVKRCQGCRVLFDKSERKAPNDLIFRYQMIREYPDPNNPGKWKKTDKVANAYFHSRDLACLRRVPELSNINENHIYIEDGVYHSLTEGHLEILDRRGHLSALKRIRATLIKKSKK